MPQRKAKCVYYRGGLRGRHLKQYWRDHQQNKVSDDNTESALGDNGDSSGVRTNTSCKVPSADNAPQKRIAMRKPKNTQPAKNGNETRPQRSPGAETSVGQSTPEHGQEPVTELNQSPHQAGLLGKRKRKPNPKYADDIVESQKKISHKQKREQTSDKRPKKQSNINPLDDTSQSKKDEQDTSETSPTSNQDHALDSDSAKGSRTPKAVTSSAKDTPPRKKAYNVFNRRTKATRNQGLERLGKLIDAVGETPDLADEIFSAVAVRVSPETLALLEQMSAGSVKDLMQAHRLEWAPTTNTGGLHLLGTLDDLKAFREQLKDIIGNHTSEQPISVALNTVNSESSVESLRTQQNTSAGQTELSAGYVEVYEVPDGIMEMNPSTSTEMQATCVTIDTQNIGAAVEEFYIQMAASDISEETSVCIEEGVTVDEGTMLVEETGTVEKDNISTEVGKILGCEEGAENIDKTSESKNDMMNDQSVNHVDVVMLKDSFVEEGVMVGDSGDCMREAVSVGEHVGCVDRDVTLDADGFCIEGVTVVDGSGDHEVCLEDLSVREVPEDVIIDMLPSQDTQQESSPQKPSQSQVDQPNSTIIMKLEDVMNDTKKDGIPRLPNGTRVSKRSYLYKNPELATHVCDICGFASTQQGLYKHKLRTHKQVLFECEVCAKTYGLRYDMRRHRIKHFDDEGNLTTEGIQSLMRAHPDAKPMKLQTFERGFKSVLQLDIQDDKNPSTSTVSQDDGAKCPIFKEVKEEGNNEDQDHHQFGARNRKVAEVAAEKSSKKIKCELCDIWTTPMGLSKHIQRHHPRMTFSCPLCTKRFAITNDLQKHLETHDASGKFSVADLREKAYCELCGLEGTDQVVLAHQKTVHKEDLFKCNFCASTFRTLHQMQCHMREEHAKIFHPARKSCPTQRLPTDDQRLTCDICHKELLASRFQQHMLTHERMGYKCELCGYTAKWAWMVRKHHAVQHLNQKPICDLCGQTFTQISALRTHIKNKHENAEAGVSLPCPHCDSTFTSERYRKTHIKRMHQGQKTHVCDICGRGFFEKIRMKEHRITVHESQAVREEQKKHECSFCGRRFSQRSYLEQHENGHRGIKPYTCKVCSRSFSWASELNKHSRAHSSEKAFTCPTCGRGFHYRYKLATHMVTHTRSSPYTCSTCSKVFTLQSTLKRHRCRGNGRYDGQMSTQLKQYEGPTSTTQDNGSMVTEQSYNVTYMCGMCRSPFHSLDEVNQHIAAMHGTLTVIMQDGEMDNPSISEEQKSLVKEEHIVLQEVTPEEISEIGEVVSETQTIEPTASHAVVELDTARESTMYFERPHNELPSVVVGAPGQYEVVIMGEPDKQQILTIDGSSTDQQVLMVPDQGEVETVIVDGRIKDIKDEPR